LQAALAGRKSTAMSLWHQLVEVLGKLAVLFFLFFRKERLIRRFRHIK
jgi:hypothetical protein